MPNTSGLASFVGGYATSIAAAGSTYADATQLSAALNIVTTVAAGEGVKLPDFPGIGPIVAVRNTDADTVVVYPPTGGSINLGAANAGVNLAQNKTGLFLPTGDGTYLFLLGA